MVQELAEIDEIVGKYEGDESGLIQVLLEVQRENRWLPKDTLKQVSQKLGVSLTQIYHVATFYKAFSLMPSGAPRLLDKVTETLKIKPGETSTDLQFSLDTVNCLGCCALGPVMVVDGEYYSKPTAKEIDQIFTAKTIEP